MTHDHRDMCWRRTAVSMMLDLRREVRSSQPTERVGLDSIGGRTLADEIVAERDRPAHDHATMDGFAFDATDEYPLTVVDHDVFPEDTPPSIEAGEAVRIATGAPLPPRANAVLKREEATVSDGRLDGPSLEPGTYTYRRGSNVTAGDHLFEVGERLSPKDALLLGALGRETVAVHRPFSVGVLATGTEIHEGRSRDLDSPMLVGLVRSWGHDATFEGTVPDEYDRVRTRIDEIATEYDVVLTTGGTSVGKKDHVIRALDDLGDVVFHRVRVRPGKPIGAARLVDHDAAAVAIPGKPVGAYVIATLVLRPFLTGLRSLPTIDATLARDVGIADSEFEYAVPVVLDEDGDAMPLGHVDSELSVYDERFDPSVLSSSTRASRADGFVLTRAALSAGEPVDVVLFSALE